MTATFKMDFWDMHFSSFRFESLVSFFFPLTKKKFSPAQVERSRLLRENEDRLDQQAVRYEERITELHSVIAELNKKIDRSHGVAFR